MNCPRTRDGSCCPMPSRALTCGFDCSVRPAGPSRHGACREVRDQPVTQPRQVDPSRYSTWHAVRVTIAAVLEERARVVADRIVLGIAPNPDDAIALGVDLLFAGHEGPGVVALAAMSPGSRWVDVEDAARAALDEIGVRVPEPSAAGWVLARYWAKQLQLGGPETYRRAAALWGLLWALGKPPEIAALVQAMDAWEEALPDQREEIEAELSMLAHPIIVVAERAIAGLD